MAEITFGIGTSHTPQMTMGPDFWEDHARRDVRNPRLVGTDGEIHTYDELVEHADPRLAQELGLGVYRNKHARIQTGLDTLVARLEAAAPDAVVIIGDDQGELFSEDGIPAIGVFAGESVWDRPDPDEDLSRLSDGMRNARWASHSEEPYEHLVAAELALHLIESLTLEEFDITKINRQAQGCSIGHAFNFVRYRLQLPQTTPIVPILLNTYIPPNVLSPGRCYRLGQGLGRAIASYPGNEKIAVIGSGGLSHFVVLDEFDQQVLEALAKKDVETISAFPRRYFRSGTSEILNWITAAGALEHLSMEVLDYVPGQRSPAGTGTGMAFATWS